MCPLSHTQKRTAQPGRHQPLAQLALTDWQALWIPISRSTTGVPGSLPWTLRDLGSGSRLPSALAQDAQVLDICLWDRA